MDLAARYQRRRRRVRHAVRVREHLQGWRTVVLAFRGRGIDAVRLNGEQGRRAAAEIRRLSAPTKGPALLRRAQGQGHYPLFVETTASTDARSQRRPGRRFEFEQSIVNEIQET